MSNQVYTSTPKQKEENETTVLREKKWHNIMEKENLMNNHRKQRFPPRKPFQAKENQRHYNFNKNQRKYFDTNNVLAEKRRKQAIESMKIAEQRRIRKVIEKQNVDKLAEELEKMNISNCSSNKLLPDGRYKLAKKHLVSRNIKQARICQYYEEQQAKKKKYVSFRIPVATNSRSTHRRPRQVFNKAIKPARKTEQPKITKNDNNTNNNKKELKIAKDPVLRYSKEQLREMCPFGYYFFP